ncbi:hypothetical protein DFH94DRAFT_841285 [Russula ochroleuca]|uniref:DUF6534 domain-containing protein n=1 Tax=Russula ochroleuca TaxID=152965 RepID=A0A9P5N5N7_9AGAM|nr:hypothetical protein DFH94DRAFT_841285 [Russula ochroleuca]
MSAPPVPSNVAEIISHRGPADTFFSAASLLFGVLWNWTLYGVLLVQLLYGIFFLETLQTALTGADLYYWFASGFGNMDHLIDPYASAFDVPIIGSIVSGAVQYFFVYRVWVLSEKKSWWLCVIISIFSGLDTIAAFAGGIYAHISGRFISGRSLKIIVLTWLAGNTVTDLLIATAMLFYLTRRRNTEFGQFSYFSNHALVRIVRLTVETNVLTTTNSAIALLVVFIFPNKFYYTCPTYILGKLYSNTLLLSLNNRISIREESSTRGTLPTSGTLTAPTFKIPESSIMAADLEMSPQAFKERKLSGEDEVQEKVIDIS